MSPDAGVVYAAGGWADNRISAWDTETFQLLGRYHGHRGGMTGLALDPSGTTLLTTGRDLTLRVWSAVPPQPEVRLEAGRDARDLAVAADGRRFATAAGDGRITVWNADTLATELLLETEERWRGCAIGRDTLYAAGASVVAFALDGGGQQATGATESCYIERMLLAPDERWLIGGHGGRLLVWQLPELTLRHVLELPIGSARFAFDERGGTFVLACTDGILRWLDPERGVVVKERFLGHDRTIEGIALSGASLHAGALLACVAGTELLEVRESDTGRSVAAAVSGVAIAPDGARVVTAGSDLKVRLWDPVTMSQLLVLGELIYSAPDVRFVAGGRRIVARSHRWNAPTYVYVWEAVPDAELPR